MTVCPRTDIAYDRSGPTDGTTLVLLHAGVAVEVALAHPTLVGSLFLVTPGGSLITEMAPELRRFIDAENAALAGGDLDAAVAANLGGARPTGVPRLQQLAESA